MNTPSNSNHAFLLKIGVLLHQHGTPSHRLENVMLKLGRKLEIGTTCLYTPTALLLAFTDELGESTYLRRVNSGQVDVDKLIRFDETLENFESGKITVNEASHQLQVIADGTTPYPEWLTVLVCSLSCASVAVFFRGSLAEVIASLFIGLMIAVLEWGSSKLNWEPGLLGPVAGFAAAIVSLAIAHFVIPIDDRLVTLAGLIVLVPGLQITVSLNELAVGHLSAGVARLAGGCVSLLTLTIGVAICWRLFAGWRNIPDPLMGGIQANDWWQWCAIFIAPITFAVIFRARWPQWPIIIAVSVAGFLASLFAGQQMGMEVGAACGALAVGCGSNLYARIRNRPALVPLTPGILILVPGSLGYRSLTAFLDSDTMAGIDLAFKMMIVAVALVGGILIANVVVPPKRIL
ncbi:MAG: threonine/serine exporter ThrE family protein [Mariniblastus sp.]